MKGSFLLFLRLITPTNIRRSSEPFCMPSQKTQDKQQLGQIEVVVVNFVIFLFLFLNRLKLQIKWFNTCHVNTCQDAKVFKVVDTQVVFSSTETQSWSCAKQMEYGFLLFPFPAAFAEIMASQAHAVPNQPLEHASLEFKQTSGTQLSLTEFVIKLSIK